MMKVTILGATGSIGRSTADVLLQHRDRFATSAVVGHRDAAGLAAVARELGAGFAALADAELGEALARELEGTGIANGAGEAAVLDAVAIDADIVVAAISGAAGLAPTYAAAVRGRRIALANKETLVCAGAAFMAEVRRHGAEVLPVDSEHNALLQALGEGAPGDVTRMVLTASGGPFRTWTAERIAAATPAEAAAHPTWSMGAKINIDSASLMNKGLELIEAHHLFGVEAERLDVVVHPQSIVHGLIEWRDGAVTAGLAVPDMRVPIAHCLGTGERLALNGRRLDLAAIGTLTFEEPDESRFPCLAIAREALRLGGAMPTIMNAANEIAVAAFMDGRIDFPGIPALVTETCEAMASRHRQAPAGIKEALAIDRESRRLAEERLGAGRPRTRRSAGEERV